VDQASQGIRTLSEVPGVCLPATVLIEQPSDTLELFRLDDGWIGIFGAKLSPGDMTEVDLVLQDAANNLFVEGLIQRLSAAWCLSSPSVSLASAARG